MVERRSSSRNGEDRLHAAAKNWEYVRLRMEDTGVNTALVFDVGTIERAIVRMETIAGVLFVAEPKLLVTAVKRLLDEVMNAEREDMSVRALFRSATSAGPSVRTRTNEEPGSQGGG